MDYVTLVYALVLLLGGGYLFITSFARKSDERVKFIKEKAQSYAFKVVIGILVLEVGETIYRTIQGSEGYHRNSISPLMFLSVILVVYLITSLIYRKNYGD